MINNEDTNFCVNGQRLPNVFLLGSQKCGTTTLANILWKYWQGAENCKKELRSFCKKEPHFFDQTGQVQLHQLEYVQMFPLCKNSTKNVMDATPDYAAFPDRIFKMFNEKEREQILFIKIVCDPVKRYESHWNHCVRDGFNWGNNCKRNQTIDENVREALSFNRRTIKNGEYIAEVEKLRKYFPDNRLVLVSNTHFFQNQEIIVKEILQMAGTWFKWKINKKHYLKIKPMLLR